MALGIRLRRRREELGLSQRELARRAHVPQPAISDIERGVQEDVTSAVLKRLARALGCTTDYLVDIYDEEQEVLPAKVVGGKRRWPKTLMTGSIHSKSSCAG